MKVYNKTSLSRRCRMQKRIIAVTATFDMNNIQKI